MKILNFEQFARFALKYCALCSKYGIEARIVLLLRKPFLGTVISSSKGAVLID
jgi:hypothetical protein